MRIRLQPKLRPKAILRDRTRSMRRQKRDMTERAYTHGYQKGVQGKSKELCPYQNKEPRTAWLSGWRSGREDG